MKRFIIIVFVVILSTTVSAFAEDVTVLAETDYFSATLTAITHAKSDITVSMYLIQVNPNDQADPANKLTEALVDTAKRGVPVKVVLENDKYKDNMNAYNMLRDAGVAVYFDDPYGFVHDKIIVIDRSISIVGSHNWTKLALSGNHDTSIMINSPETAKELLDHISSIRLTQSHVLSTGEGVALPVSFFKGKDNRCAKLFKNSADTYFDLFLVLLKEGKPNFMADYERLGKAIGLDREKVKDKITPKYYKYYYKDNVAKFLGTLRDEYVLIKFDKEKNLVEVGGSGIGDRGSEGSIVIPNEYWKYGWDKRLTFAAKYFYLISLNESKGVKGPVWWKLTQEGITKRYGMNTDSIKNAISELQRYDIIDIFRETAKKRGMSWFKPANRYLLKALYDPMALRRSFIKLKQKYGVKITEQAMGLAEELNTPNNLADVERFIQLIKQYGYEKVKEANAKTVALGPGHAKRHIGYTIRVLEDHK